MTRALLLALTLTLAASCIPDAHAQSIGGGAVGGGGGSIFNGGTITSGIVTSGVSSDLSTPANEDLNLTAGGTGVINLFGGSTTNGLKVSTVEANGNALLNLYTSTVAALLMSASDGSVAGTGYTSASATSPQFTVARGITSSSYTSLLSVYGRGTVQHVPNNALTISNPTDTSSTPLGSGTTGAGTACRMSAAGAAAWTPSETGAIDGMIWCCTNTGANAITMTDSDGVYEGPGSVVGQYDQVCMEYVTDRFIERSFSNNEP